jgi:hypothetical protein
LYHLWQNGEEIEVYDHNTAYNIVHSTEDVEQSFFAELAEGHPPATDCFSIKVLKDYVDKLIREDLIEKDRRSAPSYAKKFNTYCKDYGFDVRLVSLPSDKENILWFKYQNPNWTGLLCMKLDPVDFEFDDFDELQQELVKEPVSTA